MCTWQMRDGKVLNCACAYKPAETGYRFQLTAWMTFTHSHKRLYASCIMYCYSANNLQSRVHNAYGERESILQHYSPGYFSREDLGHAPLDDFTTTEIASSGFWERIDASQTAGVFIHHWNQVLITLLHMAVFRREPVIGGNPMPPPQIKHWESVFWPHNHNIYVTICGTGP